MSYLIDLLLAAAILWLMVRHNGLRFAVAKLSAAVNTLKDRHC
jgi:hypothetical protein